MRNLDIETWLQFVKDVLSMSSLNGTPYSTIGFVLRFAKEINFY